jgi:hypothetical protein
LNRTVDEQIAELSALIGSRFGPLATLYGRTLYDLDPDADPEEAEHERPPILLQPPADGAAVAEAEKQLKFGLPPLLKAVYTRIGNGGWCLRLLGVKGGQMGFDDIGFRRKTIVPARRLMVRVWPEVFGKPWPDRLVPISDASGCGMVEHVDCGTDEGRVWRTDSGYLTELYPSLWEYFQRVLAANG